MIMYSLKRNKTQTNLHLLLVQASRQSLDQLLSLFLVGDLQGVQVLATSDLELGVARGLLDLADLGVLAVKKQIIKDKPKDKVKTPTLQR